MVAKVDRTGEVNYNNFGSKMIITEYRGCMDVDVYFPEFNWVFKHTQYNNFKKGIIQKQIKLRWRNLVYEDFYSRNYRAYKLNYGLYGTTLTFFILLRDKMIFFNLGDGNILIQQENGYNFIFENNNYRVVNSLAHENCEDKMQYKILNRYKDLKLAIFTDGFINCFNTYEEVKSELDSTFEMLNKNIFRRYNLENKYKAHLEKLSRYGSYDDISVIFVLQNNAKL